ncbi:uncharacterized protein LOC126366823 [Pectinophora gossypiella]|nr:uncharacterized protein LOC126366823 [Pectinophora gossypiella]XP_049866071.1 uncharacterized protein LOC126366823 [Pectinophora gossypiella]
MPITRSKGKLEERGPEEARDILHASTSASASAIATEPKEPTEPVSTIAATLDPRQELSTAAYVSPTTLRHITYHAPPRSPSRIRDASPALGSLSSSAAQTAQVRARARARVIDRSRMDLPLPAPPPSHRVPSVGGSIKSREKAILRAREEVLKIKLELAELNLRRAREESENEDDSEGSTIPEREEYVDTWLKETNRERSVPPPPSQLIEGAPLQTTDPVNDGRNLVSAPNEGQTAIEEEPPLINIEEEKEKKETQRNERRSRRKLDISELASAIALAARAGQSTPAPRYISELPLFSGAHHEWLSYQAAYNESRNYYSEVENIARLRRSLRGRALEAVNSLLIANPKPDEVVKALKTRFGRPDAIAISEIEKLRSLPRCSEAPREICAFAGKIRNSVATLQALGKEQYMFNPELVRVITDKLPSILKFRWYEKSSRDKKEPDLVCFANFIDTEADYCSQFAPPEHVDMNDKFKQRAVQKIHTQVIQTDKPVLTCPVCDKSHLVQSCDVFKNSDINNRWELAKKYKLCFKCLRVRKWKHSCKIQQCGEQGCRGTHNKLLHNPRSGIKTITVETNSECVTTARAETKACTYLKVLPVRVKGPAGAMSALALLDDGSTVTLIESQMAERIGAEGVEEPLIIEAIGDTRISTPRSKRVKIEITGMNNYSITLSARTANSLNISPQAVSPIDIVDCDHLREFRNEIIYEGAKPTILIGQDNWNLLIADQIRIGKKGQPIASRTPLGWVLHGTRTRSLGQLVDYVNRITEVNYCNNDNDNDCANQLLKQYFSLESLLVNPKRPHSDPEMRAERLLHENTKRRDDGRIETSLLWRRDDIVMPNNYENAYRRLLSVEKKLDREPDLKVRYHEEMNALIEKGYAEPAPENSTPGRTWYLPHFEVRTPAKPGKVRIVHDAAAKYRNVCLNDHLLTGPDLLQSLPGVLMRFRRHPIAVTADIAEMFMQVKIREEDRDALRYLWRGNDRDGPPREYRMSSLIFGASSSPCTAIFAKNWNAKRHADTHPEAVAAIENHHYMDDYLDSFPTEEIGIETALLVRNIHREGHFELRKWNSNSKRILQAVKGEQHTETVSIGPSLNMEKVLGLVWRPESDNLEFNPHLARVPPVLLENKSPTKREALKIVMSLFDPLGLASPVTVRAKLVLQEAWRRGTGWDEVLDDDLSERWGRWLNDLRDVLRLTIPRCYKGYSTAARIEMHTFVDASEVAYAAAVYWRITTPDGEVHLSLVLAKARIAPVKIMSIPRLELQAAVLGSRLAASVLEEHHIEIESKTYWTDSKTVLTWITSGSKSYKPFVAHRVAAIEEHTAVNEWRWVPSRLNVADIATRETTPSFTQASPWFTGPDFLREGEATWPHDKPPQLEITGEERTMILTEVRERARASQAIPDPSRFSRWERLQRATARVLQFLALCRVERTHYKRTMKKGDQDPDWKKTSARRVSKQRPVLVYDNDVKNFLPLDALFIQQAETLLVRASQEETFPEEVRDVEDDKVVSSHSRLRLLPIEMRGKLLCIRSRIAAAEDISEPTRSPPVLDGNHRVTRLYIDWTHRSLHHGGVEMTINEIRQHYWVIKLRTTTRSIVKSCLMCRIRRATPPVPATGNHPRTRLAHHQRPFTFTGLDYFGPLSVTVGRQHQKRYVALFTCLTTREVHLEVAASLSADSAILALRRMIARRGCPSEIHSDNGTNMHGADRELRRALQDEASQRSITWRFITPSAPFMGGAWERLVRTVKTALLSVLHERHPREEVLATLLCEVEYSVNSRPLTHVSVEATDDEAITPNHFLLGGSARVPLPGTFTEKDIDHQLQWRRAQYLADLFWKRWLKEYLPELQYRREPHGRGPSIQLGDPVLIVDGQLPRNTWPRGLVVAVYPGADNVVRTVEVRTAGGLLKRPVKKLVLLPK